MRRTSIASWLITAFAVLSPLEAAWAGNYSGLVVFGDSITDSGNHAKVNGVDATQTISGNDYYPWQAYSNGSFSNGPVWAEHLATQLGLPALKASALGGGNYAFAFAKVLSPGGGQPYSLPVQLNQYLNRTGAQGLADPDALYVLEGGTNDLFFDRKTQPDSAAANLLSQRYANAMGQMVDKLQAAGAKHIVVWNVPNIGLAPGVASEGASVSTNAGALASKMNTALAQRMASEGPEVQLFDVNGLWAQWREAGPGPSGFSNVKDACGAATSQCDVNTALFWDAIHPTTYGHKAMADVLAAQISPVPEATSLAMMGAGLLGVVGVARRRMRPAK